MNAIRSEIASLERRIARGGAGVTKLRVKLTLARHRLLQAELRGQA